MAKKIAYENLPFLPTIMADAVCGRRYTGEEISSDHQDSREIEKIEALRQKMTLEQIREFGDACDERCRQAYTRSAEWFIKCVKAKGNAGRDQLLDVWIPHWMAAYLKNPKRFIEQWGKPCLSSL